ncbi:TFIIH basal transcription factor complex subunit 2 [Lodderomyces elongisporus NRRL YB-4239]|uniref:RNA polymerase II transcription factor B subunit 2 n=1 Tax=Lodderomyces elongisporus (strain ATCC 11503 / CBS 2605 / JCM 1781 / NBRC 1676 / NRRL YB-4239) TaxID=379508 RepID=A5E0Z2_LODEL|nr:TFIIH basal transcription factor complex subunit 2 [Lodderomyces elongisporus NRRL YB-4239]
MSSNLFKATVNEYLEDLPKAVQLKLYEAPATCLAIYRLLSSMAKFYIMSMIFTEKPVSMKDLTKWCKPLAKKLEFDALKRLESLHLIEFDSKGTHLRLNTIFRTNFRDCLTGSQDPNAFGSVSTTADPNKVDLAFLDSFASQKWESILHFMVGTEGTKPPSKSVLSLLKLGGLMEQHEEDGTLNITNTGFQFLLQDVNAQIWTLLLQYLNLTQELNMDAVDVLNFIFILGSLELGNSYSVSNLSETQVSMLADLKDYGLVYQKSDTSSRFYPTRLATTLTSDSAALKTPSMAVEQALDETETSLASSTQTKESIIIETNFKMYAYTNSPLEIAILNLFVHMKTRFSNMICGQITRESIRNALYNGITADQIIKFLETHAHPQMRALAKERLDKKVEFDASHNINTAGGAPQSKTDGAISQHRLEVLPPNVVDQIKLWQLELDRIQTFDGYLFKDFANQQEYDMLSNYAAEIGVLIWADKVKKKFFVTKDGMTQVAEFANRKLR